MDNKVNSTLIELKDISIGYGNKVLHKNINIIIEQNDFIGLVGPNGSGKTTFLKTLLGNIKPLFGSINKKEITFGYVPQRDTVQPLLPYSVYDVVMMGRYSLMGLLKLPSKIDEHIVDSSLEKVGISVLRNHSYNSLSGGQRQRTLIARALAVEPLVLILDEPTNGMDTPSHYSLLNLISELHNKNNLTVLLVSHLLSDVANLVKKLMLFEAGRFRSGTIEDMLSEKNLGQTYSANIEVKKINGEYHIASRHKE
ncbi:MAG: metal ABC transporter ATP-binding protein [Ignavibacteria bacterium]|nr:metal ABC transporter ATP-binding protein [Ignavibacteria bacterium]MBT8381372.1 metal ABC transporter ATP-binding protein [Ignavibacteria bacterium]MBT8390976.1 metal ABC transporter ATP-binding protein [Ignavibacteria bacterium]NNJ54384.1 metal ABC transporter ATP-binding protein [Ignavibacteriaceae bacterium]NNL21696.1 metal ABC transporter ATP-binding protein [Ignavibacteriaceae bacterium]